MGLLGDRVLGLCHLDCDVDCVCRGHGVLLWCLVLGVGRGRNTVRAPRAGGRPVPTDRGLLSGFACPDLCDGLGMGGRGVGGHEIFPTCGFQG